MSRPAALGLVPVGAILARDPAVREAMALDRAFGLARAAGLEGRMREAWQREIVRTHATLERRRDPHEVWQGVLAAWTREAPASAGAPVPGGPAAEVTAALAAALGPDWHRRLG